MSDDKNALILFIINQILNDELGSYYFRKTGNGIGAEYYIVAKRNSALYQAYYMQKFQTHLNNLKLKKEIGKILKSVTFENNNQKEIQISKQELAELLYWTYLNPYKETAVPANGSEVPVVGGSEESFSQTFRGSDESIREESPLDIAVLREPPSDTGFKRVELAGTADKENEEQIKGAIESKLVTWGIKPKLSTKKKKGLLRFSSVSIALMAGMTFACVATLFLPSLPIWVATAILGSITFSLSFGLFSSLPLPARLFIALGITTVIVSSLAFSLISIPFVAFPTIIFASTFIINYIIWRKASKRTIKDTITGKLFEFSNPDDSEKVKWARRICHFILIPSALACTVGTVFGCVHAVPLLFAALGFATIPVVGWVICGILIGITAIGVALVTYRLGSLIIKNASWRDTKNCLKELFKTPNTTDKSRLKKIGLWTFYGFKVAATVLICTTIVGALVLAGYATCRFWRQSAPKLAPCAGYLMAGVATPSKMMFNLEAGNGVRKKLCEVDKKEGEVGKDAQESAANPANSGSPEHHASEQAVTTKKSDASSSVKTGILSNLKDLIEMGYHMEILMRPLNAIKFMAGAGNAASQLGTSGTGPPRYNVAIDCNTTTQAVINFCFASQKGITSTKEKFKFRQEAVRTIEQPESSENSMESWQRWRAENEKMLRQYRAPWLFRFWYAPRTTTRIYRYWLARRFCNLVTCCLEIMCKNEKNVKFSAEADLSFVNKRPVYVLIFDTTKNSWELRCYSSKEQYKDISIIHEVNGLDALLKDKTDKTADSRRIKEKITSYEYEGSTLVTPNYEPTNDGFKKSLATIKRLSALPSGDKFIKTIIEIKDENSTKKVNEKISKFQKECGDFMTEQKRITGVKAEEQTQVEPAQSC